MIYLHSLEVYFLEYDVIFQQQKVSIIWLSALGILVVFISDCKNNNPEEEFDKYVREASIWYCKLISENPRQPKHSRSLAESAIQKWESKKLDPEPILIRAILVKPERLQCIMLGLQASDEDLDMLGIILKENHIKSNGQKEIIEEKYPVYADDKVTVTKLKLINVKIRENNERKDEELWQDYLFVGVPNKYTMPKVLISAPDAGKIEVEICVYDREGHESAPVPLENFLILNDPNSLIEEKNISEVFFTYDKLGNRTGQQDLREGT